MMSPEDVKLVAIGASAGGLEPLEGFFSGAPEHSGWSFVVIQHLSPDYRSMMDELLGRRSRLKIRHIADGEAPLPDTIYLNRPNTMAELIDGLFHVTSFREGDVLPRLPIDTFFRSVAQRPAGTTVGVILSGSGSDGTKGAVKLREQGGVVLVQAPAEASFTSMPVSAINAGAVDRVLKVVEMPRAIEQIFSGKLPDADPAELAEAAMPRILKLLENSYHLDFGSYKSANVDRRVERRKSLRGVESITEYVDLLSEDSAALEELYQDLLIGVTEFYRDPEAIAVLRRQVLDKLAAQDTDQPLRVWVPACASGEEAYTIAIELNEALLEAGTARRFRIIATDVHRTSLERASAGVYSAASVAKMPPRLLSRYFEKCRESYVIEPILRQKIIFSGHDVLSDPPFMNLDLVSCRNLFIYLNEEPQARVLSMFLFGLKQEGYLFLGPSESLGRFSDEFRALDSRWRLFQKVSRKRIFDRALLTGKFRTHVNYELPSAVRRPVRQEGSVVGEIADLRNRDMLMHSYDALLKRYAPSSILISGEGQVLGWFGTASIFIDTMNNLADWTVEEIVHQDLHFSINVAMEKLRQGQLETYTRTVKVHLGDSVTKRCTVRIEALDQVSRNKIMLVAISLEDEADGVVSPEVPGPVSLEDVSLMNRRVQELERDLRLTEETLQHVTERLEASGEELQASNEELQASNEELQASNEELQSSNEELHAVNEELVSVSAEHERKIELLSELNADTELVLRRMGVGVIFVDAQFRIRRFSEILGRDFKLEAHDIDRSLEVVAPRIDFVELPKLVQSVISHGTPTEARGAHRGREVLVRAYPTLADEGEGIDGALIILQYVTPGDSDAF